MNTLEQIRVNRQSLKNTAVFYLDRDRTIGLLDDIKVLFFPQCFSGKDIDDEELLKRISDDLRQEISKVSKDTEAADRIIKRLPIIQDAVYKDVEAIYNGDPSAKTYEEIVLSFPGFLAVFAYRVAHELYVENIPVIPRIMTEYAHEKTGIDINPGATIGEYFCIDHGTGIVIGETATVGNHVRMYHGVTLGVRSFRKDKFGNLLKGGKRHPDVGDNVILYANATVLGGDTRIESGSVIPTGSLIIQTPETFK
ncbi:MAG: serine acetyltransferase [Erysipelotrichaceae bacterium]|nr:serine acetyltransferase [Erysipelotrichaceae bacterium]